MTCLLTFEGQGLVVQPVSYNPKKQGKNSLHIKVLKFNKYKSRLLIFLLYFFILQINKIWLYFKKLYVVPK